MARHPPAASAASRAPVRASSGVMAAPAASAIVAAAWTSAPRSVRAPPAAGTWNSGPSPAAVTPITSTAPCGRSRGPASARAWKETRCTRLRAGASGSRTSPSATQPRRPSEVRRSTGAGSPLATAERHRPASASRHFQPRLSDAGAGDGRRVGRGVGVAQRRRGFGQRRLGQDLERRCVAIVVGAGHGQHHLAEPGHAGGQRRIGVGIGRGRLGQQKIDRDRRRCDCPSLSSRSASRRLDHGQGPKASRLGSSIATRTTGGAGAVSGSQRRARSSRRRSRPVVSGRAEAARATAPASPAASPRHAARRPPRLTRPAAGRLAEWRRTATSAPAPRRSAAAR